MSGKPGPPEPMPEGAITPANSNALGILRQFAHKDLPLERCELCSTALSREHAHLVELSAHRLLCACPACALLFDAGANRRYKRVPRRVRLLQSFHMTDAQWDSLLLPINMAFFYSSSVEGAVAAFYPSPAGAVESLLSLEAWNDIVKENPALRDMEPDVEALLVNRVGYSRGTAMAGYFIAPMDECYKLVGLIRAGWRGLSGGTEVWEDIQRFFDQLRQRAEIVAGEEHA